MNLTLGFLLIALIKSRLIDLVRLLCENLEVKLKDAFRFCEGLKIPSYSYEGKIVYPCIMANGSCFVYEEKGFFAPAPANIITGKEYDMKYLTGLLNSSFVYFA